MSDPEDGPWDAATEHDDGSAELGGEDPPTVRASLAQRVSVRSTSRLNQSGGTLPPSNETRPPAAPAAGAPAAPVETALRPASSIHETPTPTSLAAIPREAIPPIASPNIISRPPNVPAALRAAAEASMSDVDPPTVVNPGGIPAPARPRAAAIETRPARPTTSDDVILLDTVSANAPVGEAPRRGEAASGGIVIVATGGDGDRIRKLCHGNGLLVPVMASLSVVHESVSIVVIGEPSPPAPDRVVHVVRPSIGDAQLVSLLRALASDHAVVEPAPAKGPDEPRVTDAARRLSTLDDRGAIEMIAIEAITAITEADRAHCLFHDPFTGSLWSEGLKRSRGDARRAMGGLVGWAALTGEAIHASPAGEDPRWLQELDDPEGKSQSRVLVQPVIGADRRVHAVLVAARRWRHNPFTDEERGRLARFAALVAPTIDLAIGTTGDGTKDRRPRTTQPGLLSRATGNEAARQQAAVVDPRARRPSAPPVVAARPASASKPPPIASQPAPASAPRPASASKPPPIASQPAPAFAPPVAPPVGARPSAPPVAAPVAPPVGARPSAAPAAPVAPTPSTRTKAGSRDPRVATPVAGTPTAAPTAASTGSFDRPKSDSAPPPRTKSDSNAPKPAREGEQHEVAVVTTDAESVARAKRIAKRARVELVTMPRAEEVPPYYRIVTIGQAWTPDADPRIVYAARDNLTDDQLADLLAGLATDRSIVPPPSVSTAQGAAEARRAQLAFAGSRKLAVSTDLADAEAIATSTMRELLDADRAYCLYYDSKTGALWSEARKRSAGDDRRAIAGVTGWVARTGKPAAVDRASADPRWLAPLDDPDGDANSQLLVQPIVGADRRVHGVLVAVRRAKRPGFGELDATQLARFAALVAPLLEQLAVHVATQQLLGDTTGVRAPLAARNSPMDLLARAPRWAFAAAGAVIMLLVVLAMRC